MPYDWIDANRGNISQTNREDASMSDEERAIAEERSRSLRVPGIVPGKIVGEEGSVRGVPPTGIVFDDKGMPGQKAPKAPRQAKSASKSDETHKALAEDKDKPK